MVDYYIRRHGRKLYGLCMTLCANTDDADELYQDTWIKVIENISKYDQARDFGPWLTRICVNIYRNKLRRLLRSPIWDGFASGEEKDALINSIPAPTPDDNSDLHEAINRLPEKLRLTVILFYFEDMDAATAAKALGIPAGTVKSRLNKARKMLREALENKTDIQF